MMPDPAAPARTSHALWVLSSIALLAPIQTTGQWSALQCPMNNTIKAIYADGTGEVLVAGVDWAQSLNGGDTWTHFYPQDQQSNDLIAGYRDVVRLSPDVLVAGASWGSMDQYVIFQTENNGSVWNTAYVNASGAWPLVIEDLDFYSASAGFACGSNGRIQKTTNAGSSWTAVSNPMTEHLYGVVFWESGDGVFISGTKSYRMLNGTSWGVERTLGTGYRAIHELGECVAVAAGDGEISITTDCAQNWTGINGPWGTANDVYAFNLDTILVATTEGLYVTHDGGILWEQFPDFVGMSVEEVTFVDGTLGYATVGSEVYKTTNGGGPSGPIADLNYWIGDPECGARTVHLSSGSEPGLQNSWFYNGELVGDQVVLTYTFTEPVNTGTFVLEVSNGQNSDTASWSVTMLVDQPFTTDAGPDVVLCAGDTTQLQAFGGSSFVWAPGAGLGDALSANPLVWAHGTYVVTAATGPCSDQDTVRVVPPELEDPWTWNTVIPYSSQQWMTRMHPFSASAVAYTASSNSPYRMTLDGGASIITRPLPFFWLSSLQMINPYLGYALGGPEGGDQDRLYRTEDAWQTVSLVVPDTVYSTLAAHFYSADTGVVMQESSAAVRLIYTTDGGMNWEIRFEEDLGPSNTVFFTPSWDTTLIFNGYTQRFWITHDAGANWAQSAFQLPLGEGDPAGVVSDGSGTLFMIPNDDTPEAVYRSEDGGFNWTATPLLINGRFIFSPGADSCYVWYQNNQQGTVDGGECWGLVEESWESAPTLNKLAYTPDQVLFRMLRDGSYGVIEREDLSDQPPSLGFEVNAPSQCLGLELGLWNTSINYEGFQWLVDGALVSSAVVPEPMTLAAGEHTITLIGTIGMEQDTVARLIEIHPVPTEIPTIATLGLNCESLDSLGVFTPGVAGASGYQWYGGNQAWVAYGDHNDTTYLHYHTHSGSPDNYAVAVAAINEFGCRGPWSDTLEIPFHQGSVAWITSGPEDICKDVGVPVTADYTAFNPSDAELVWSIDCPDLGTIQAAGNSAQVIWNGSEDFGYCDITLHAYDTCGLADTDVLHVHLISAYSWIAQPQAQTLNEGQQALFSCYVDGTSVGSYQWYFEGVPIPGANGTTLVIPDVTLNDAGLYWVKGMVMGCEDMVMFESDHVPLTILAQNVPVSQFSAADTVCVGGSVQFSDVSTNNPNAWAWYFEGGVPSNSYIADPTIVYPSPGTFTVTLQASNTSGSGSIATGEIVVSPCTGIAELGHSLFSIYPNPTHGTVWIRGSSPGSLCSVMDLAGRRVLATPIADDGSISLAGLSEGQYLLQFLVAGKPVRLPVQLMR